MKILVDKSFERDARRLAPSVQKDLAEIIGKIEKTNSLNELKPAKMAGAENAYRIRFGNYRIGMYSDGEFLILSRVLDRKDIYKYFPKK